jgi:glucan phosphoethanolaminetransferase (alkaline phosphatase superfamily)
MIRKNAFRLVGLIVVFIILSLFSFHIPGKPADLFYTIAGIMFSIGFSQLISFDFSKIKNELIYKEFTKSIEEVKCGFFLYFSLSSVAILLLKVPASLPEVKINQFTFKIESLCMLFLLYSIVYFVMNFEVLYKTKNSIDKRIRQEQEIE